MDTDFDADDLGSIEVSYSIGDIVALQIAAWRYWLGIASFPFVLFGLLSLIPVVTGDESFQAAVAPTDWLVPAIITMCMIGALMLAMALGYAIRQLRGKHEKIMFGLVEQGAVFCGPDGEGTIFWKSLKRVVSNDQRLMLFLSSSSAFIVPKRCFSDSATFDRWTLFSKARWAAAKNRSQ